MITYFKEQEYVLRAQKNKAQQQNNMRDVYMVARYKMTLTEKECREALDTIMYAMDIQGFKESNALQLFSSLIDQHFKMKGEKEKKMKLTPQEVDKLGKAFNLAYDLVNTLESLRPAGGFKEYLDKAYCRECGEEKE